MRYTLTPFWNDNFLSLNRDLDRFFDILDHSQFSAKQNEKTWSIPCDLQESESHYLVSLDLPGIPKENIHVEFDKNQLTVTAERKEEKKEEDQTHHLIERTFGTYKRVFTLPKDVDPEKIEASCKDGVLQLAIAKAEKSKPRKIQIQDGSDGFLGKFLGRKKEDKSSKNEKVA